MTNKSSWFEEIFGFEELNRDVVLENLEVSGTRMRSRANGSCPTSIGLNRSTMTFGSLPSGLSADPRKAFPSIPLSVITRTSAICAVRAPELVTRLVYRVGGMFFHSQTVTFMSDIFIQLVRPLRASIITYLDVGDEPAAATRMQGSIHVAARSLPENKVNMVVGLAYELQPSDVLSGYQLLFVRRHR